jgi:thiol-disulfide isomerase/thioredoxin
MKVQVCVTIILLSTAFYVVDGQSDNIAVEKIDKPKLEQLLNNRDGKVLFINLWATWCIPCREEFPSIIKLVNEFKDKPVDFYGISTDYPDEVESKIIPFLIKQNVNFINLVNGYEEDEDLINAFDKKWNGALPATFIFDKYGKKISFLEGKQSFQKFKREIEKAMKE